jgi:hypothetical protein
MAPAGQSGGLTEADMGKARMRIKESLSVFHVSLIFIDADDF